MRKNTAILVISAVSFAALFFFDLKAEANPSVEAHTIKGPLAIIQGNSLSALTGSAFTQPKVKSTIKMVLTAYSSTPEETDNTPFITASGSRVADGIVANNMLPFGTEVRIPEIYGDKIFVVEDRMNARMSDNRIDIWFPEHRLAEEFGVKRASIEILEN